MKWLEVIEIRLADVSKFEFEQKLNELLMELKHKESFQKIRMYKHAVIETDFSIHLLYESDTTGVSFDSLGARLVDAIKEFGLVHHGLWIEKEI